MRLTIDNPIEPIDEAALKLGMEGIIATDAFFSTNGSLVAPGNAHVIERNVTEYEIG